MRNSYIPASTLGLRIPAGKMQNPKMLSKVFKGIFQKKGRAYAKESACTWEPLLQTEETIPKHSFLTAMLCAGVKKAQIPDGINSNQRNTRA